MASETNEKKLSDWMKVIDLLEQAYKIATYIDGDLAKQILMQKNTAADRAANVAYAIQRSQWVSTR